MTQGENLLSQTQWVESFAKNYQKIVEEANTKDARIRELEARVIELEAWKELVISDLKALYAKLGLSAYAPKQED